MKVTGIEVPWREGELDFRGVVGYSSIGDRAAVATGDEVVIGSAPVDQLRRSAIDRARREGAAG